METAVEDVNEEMEAAERRKKDELKQRRVGAGQEQTQSSWRCSKQGCHFTGQSKVGLVNHIRHAEAQLSGTASPTLPSLWELVL